MGGGIPSSLYIEDMSYETRFEGTLEFCQVVWRV